jgi:WD40 repeat protein
VKTELIKEIKLPTAVLGLDAAPDGKLLYTACLDGGIYEINAESGEFALIGQHESYASGVALLTKSSLLVSAGYDGMVQWHDFAARKTIRKIAAHKFWSWQMAVSRDGHWVASATGQYLAGGYKYEPALEQEPSVKVFNAQSGELVHSFSHLPPVLSIAFSPDNQALAAANMMGDVRIWDLASGRQMANWNTPSFTSWGIIKSHHYIGGIYALSFTPDGNELVAGGMGPMRDPMAGNGKQTWQRFAWRENPVKKVDEIHEGEHGNGLMETLAFHPSNAYFVMAGRLAQGKWNTAFFDSQSGALVHSLDAKNRVTKAVFGSDGQRLFLGITLGQPKPKDGKFPDFGRIAIYSIA